MSSVKVDINVVDLEVQSIFEQIEEAKNENANSKFSNNFVELMFQGIIQKRVAKYDLDNCDETLYQKYLDGDLHIHDLVFWLRPNCLQHPIYKVYENGLDALSCTSTKAKHLDTALSHAVNTLGLGQAHFAGGQSIPMFNVFIAPFCKGMKPKRIRQCVQQFIYQGNQISASRGLQSIFMSLNIELEIPEFMKDVDVVYKKGKFGDYEKEMKLFTKILIEEMNKCDGKNVPFMFPNIICNIRKGEFNEKDMNLVNLIVKNMVEHSNTYFLNSINTDNKLITSMGCRTKVSANKTGDVFKDVFGTGNLSYITLNLPRLAMTSHTDDEFYDKLEDLLISATKILMVKRNRIWKCWSEGMYPFVQNKLYSYEEEDNYYNIGYTTMGIGVVGMNEVLQYMPELKEKDILGYIKEFNKRLNERTYNDIAEELGIDYTNYLKEEVRFSLIGSPAESCSERFKRLDDEKFSELVFDELKDKKYYTNSIMVREDANISAHQKIMYEQTFHNYFDGGIITHLWNATKEQEDYTSLSKYLLKILSETDTSYITISNMIVNCEDCKTSYIGSINDKKCKNCGGTNLKYFQKITGYLAPVTSYNDGKLDELENRGDFDI